LHRKYLFMIALSKAVLPEKHPSTANRIGAPTSSCPS
jgi:hypothetical protein